MTVPAPGAAPDGPDGAAPWSAAVLGRARLVGPGADVPLERKAAALLTYLALEGPTHRARLSLLLWPETREAAARNNLVQLLRKLRVTTGHDVVSGGDVLSLAPDFGVDAAAVRALVTQGRPADFAATAPALLAGLTYDDCPDLDDWLAAERARWAEWHVAALRETSGELERAGDLDGALAWALRLTDADPVSEDAWRRVMRLHYLRGDRPAALRAYRTCVEMLGREFGSAPLPDTAALAREIERGAVAVPPRPVAAPPLATLRPPRLVGREAVWAELDAAWAAGQWIVIEGDPGVGKTRLALDFAASRGGVLVCAGRPGDAIQPLATTARALRAVTGQLGPDALEPWVRRELSRVLPELAPDERPAPMTGEADVLRFRQAQLAAYRALPPAVLTVVADDLQAFDAGSRHDLDFVFRSAAPLGALGGLPRLIVTCRRGELPPETAQTVQGLVEQGVAAHVRLPPLPETEGDTLLDDLGVPADPARRAQLWRHAGGNPLFLLETVRLLHGTGELAGGSGPLPMPDKVRALIARRLTGLSPRALQAARAAATLQRDFDLDLVAQVLGAPLLDVASAWEELETAQVAQGERFTHDLILEGVAADTPASVRSLLHRSAARALARADAAPARVARHWQEGGRPADAAAAYTLAAQEARARYQIPEAARLYGLAAELHGDAEQDAPAFDALNARLTLFDLTGSDAAGFRTELERLDGLARTPAQRGQAVARRAEYLGLTGDQEAMERTAQGGLALAHEAGDERLEARLQEITAVANLKLGRPRVALPALERLRVLGQRLGEVPMQALALQGLGLVYQVSSPRDALAVYREAQALGRGNDLRGQVAILTRVAHMLAVLGDVRAAERGYDEALNLLVGSEGVLDVQLLALYGRASCRLTLGEPGRAWQDVQAARQLDPADHVAVSASVGLAEALALLALGQPGPALDVIDAVLAHPAFQVNLRPRAHAIRGSVLAALGRTDEAHAAFHAAAADLGDEPGVGLHAELLARRAAAEAPDARARTAAELDALAREHGLRGFGHAAAVHAALAGFLAGAATALPPAPEEDGDPVFDPGELHAARALAAPALGLDAAPEWAAADRWVQATLPTVPDAFREGFLARHTRR
ncbi:BTAD domain-containing putative transcriptional regulator [uncultured Deinococcus sp.]|uniref:ATP-binding protein n=1 Tax=uncultured Deinococcus sp. TaxID=158789 RepID=UPI0025D40BAA|nr:BTAD domain-containing putative transcriptional regulator [uncultured Deinococcus sp.]